MAVIRIPGKPTYRSPRYDKVSEEWDRKYAGKDGDVLSPREQMNKVRVRTWIDAQNNLKRKPKMEEGAVHTHYKKKPKR